MEERPDFRRRKFLPPVAQPIVIQRHLGDPRVMDCSCKCNDAAGSGDGSGRTARIDLRQPPENSPEPKDPRQ
jgi:hypothetical protein